MIPQTLWPSPWNNKILDYEIETNVYLHCNSGDGKPWNNKILDYEIETGYTKILPHAPYPGLETIRFSITRLKHPNRIRSRLPLLTWNNKILDYEIETKRYGAYPLGYPHRTWNNKILDYEIETFQLRLLSGRSLLNLKQ